MASSPKIRKLIAAAGIALALTAGGATAADRGNPEAKRIVSIGGTITEILCALGAEDRIVARDSTSLYPESIDAKPDVGYMRALSAEGIMGQKPDLVLLEEGSGPPPVIEILKASQIATVVIPTPPQVDQIGRKIREVGAAVGLGEKAEALAVKTEAELEALAAEVAKISAPRKKVLFVLSISSGRIMAGGADTEAGAIIEMAGGVNAASTIRGYKPLSDEAVIAAQPDVVLSMSRGNHTIAADQMFSVPSLQATPANANRTLIVEDGLFLIGFGPRTPAAARKLASALYPGAIN